ncbi:MAG: hypothetical protein RL685_2832 [Pseudomonadota bacterium]|jgi:hypothetical protein
MYPRSRCWLAAGLALACQQIDDDQERCADVSAQIEQALTDYTANGVLLPGAEPCELTLESFDPRVREESVEYVLGAFASACEQREGACWDVPRYERPQPAPPPSAPPPFASPAEPAIAR